MKNDDLFSQILNEEEEDDFFDPTDIGLPLDDEQEHDIAMHCEAHFGGSYELMLRTYINEGKGVQEDLEIDVIERMAVQNNEIISAGGRPLSNLLLQPAERLLIQRVRASYQQLRELCEMQNPQNPLPKILAELILSEEADEDAAIDALIAHAELDRDTTIRSLIEILRSDDFANPLFPGYGLAPELAARCLGRIPHPLCVRALFEHLGLGDFFCDETLAEALRAQSGALEFLLERLKSRPLSRDNINALHALLTFTKESDRIASASLAELEKLLPLDDISFSSQLILGCEGLASKEEQERFRLLESRLSSKREKDLFFKIAECFAQK